MGTYHPVVVNCQSNILHDLPCSTAHMPFRVLPEHSIKQKVPDSVNRDVEHVHDVLPDGQGSDQVLPVQLSWDR
jgi:hypothetical protein